MGHFDQQSEMLHLVGEVPAVELALEDGLVQVLELGEGEDLRQEVEAHRLEEDVLPEPLARDAEDLVVVEGEAGDVFHREPFGLVGVGVALHLGESHQGVMGDGDHALARVAVDVAEGAHFLEILRVHLQLGLLPEFPGGRMGDGLVPFHVQKAAGEGPEAHESPCAGLFLLAALDQEHFQLLAVIAENDAVRRDGRMRILVGVGAFLCHGLFCWKPVRRYGANPPRTAPGNPARC